MSELTMLRVNLINRYWTVADFKRVKKNLKRYRTSHQFKMPKSWIMAGFNGEEIVIWLEGSRVRAEV